MQVALLVGCLGACVCCLLHCGVNIYVDHFTLGELSIVAILICLKN